MKIWRGIFQARGKQGACVSQGVRENEEVRMVGTEGPKFLTMTHGEQCVSHYNPCSCIYMSLKQGSGNDSPLEYKMPMDIFF